MSLAFFWIFLLLMLCGLPVMFALLVAPSLSLMIDGQANFFTLLIGRMYKGIDNFPLMAIPFFILAGEMMNAGQITVNLVRLSQALIGHVRGGLAPGQHPLQHVVRGAQRVGGRGHPPRSDRCSSPRWRGTAIPGASRPR